MQSAFTSLLPHALGRSVVTFPVDREREFVSVATVQYSTEQNRRVFEDVCRTSIRASFHHSLLPGVLAPPPSMKTTPAPSPPSHLSYRWPISLALTL